jgi:vancomycin resistance protein YoaR
MATATVLERIGDINNGLTQAADQLGRGADADATAKRAALAHLTGATATVDRDVLAIHVFFKTAPDAQQRIQRQIYEERRRFYESNHFCTRAAGIAKMAEEIKAEQRANEQAQAETKAEMESSAASSADSRSFTSLVDRSEQLKKEEEALAARLEIVERQHTIAAHNAKLAWDSHIMTFMNNLRTEAARDVAARRDALLGQLPLVELVGLRDADARLCQLQFSTFDIR